MWNSSHAWLHAYVPAMKLYTASHLAERARARLPRGKGVMAWHRPGKSFQDLGLFSSHDRVLYVSCACGDRRDRLCGGSRVVFVLLSVSCALVSSPKRYRALAEARGRYSARSLQTLTSSDVTPSRVRYPARPSGRCPRTMRRSGAHTTQASGPAAAVRGRRPRTAGGYSPRNRKYSFITRGCGKRASGLFR